MRASSPGERRQNQLRRSLPPIRSPNQIRKSPHCPGSGYRYARFSENHVWPSRVFMIEAPAAASAARNPAPAARPFPEGPQHPFAPRALRSQHAMPRALVTASQILSRILEDPSLPRRRRNQTGMLFTAETQRRRDKRRAHATTASWWNGLGNLARGARAEARRKQSPSCARIGRLKAAPPKQSELRSDGQAGGLSHNAPTKNQ
jgi:hypothetical protein